MAIFTALAEGDTIYIEAETLEDAKEYLDETIGPVPDDLVTWGQVDELPDGEELL